MYPLIDIFETAPSEGKESEFPDYILNHVAIQELRSIGGLLVALGNELCSAPKEMAAKWINCVTAHSAIDNVPIVQSFLDIAKMHNDAVVRFDEIVSKEMPSFDEGGTLDQQVSIWIRYLRMCSAGFNVWHASAARYTAKTLVDLTNKRYLKMSIRFVEPDTTLSPNK